MTWPADFRFGASTCAPCVEGGALANGRLPSSWDWFARREGAIADRSSPDPAADHLKHLTEDLDLLRELGIDAYRATLSWSRVLPQGHGQINTAGLDVYDRLVDQLLERRIEPWLCLHHGDLPAKLQQRGGWANRETAHWFVEYTGAVLRRLGDRLDRIVLLGAPNTLAVRGHLLGEHAPGAHSIDAWAAAQHHLNLAVALGAAAVRELRPHLEVGLELELDGRQPWREEPDDHEAMQRYCDLWQHAMLRPLIEKADGSYPEAFEGYFAPHQLDEDPVTLAATDLDLIGVRHATRRVIAPDPGPFGYRLVPPAPHRSNLLGVDATTAGLLGVLHDLRDQTARREVTARSPTNDGREGVGEDEAISAEELPAAANPRFYVVATGGAWPDSRAAPLEDRSRIAYLDGHLDAVSAALEQGLPVCGWFYEPLLDGFQWQHGLSARSGLLQVDFETGRRQRRASFDWWARWLRERPTR